MNLIRFQRPAFWDMPAMNRLSDLRDEIDRLFDLSEGREFFGWAPALDVYEDADAFLVKVELPGMKKDEIDLSLHNDTLTISGERKSEQVNGESSRSERYFGRFQRTFQLPKPVQAEKVEATYKDGILTVRLPKTEESKPKRIDVKVS